MEKTYLHQQSANLNVGGQNSKTCSDPEKVSVLSGPLTCFLCEVAGVARLENDDCPDTLPKQHSQVDLTKAFGEYSLRGMKDGTESERKEKTGLRTGSTLSLGMHWDSSRVSSRF